MSNNMADEKEKEGKSETTKDSSSEEKDQEDTEKEKSQSEAEKVKQGLLKRLREEKAKRVTAEKSTTDESDVEGMVRKMLKDIRSGEQESIEKEKQLVEKEMEQLHKTYGDFEEKGLLDFVNDYGIQGDDGLTDWVKAIELYNSVQAKKGGPQIRMPKGKKTSDKPQKEKYEPTGKSLTQIADEAIRELGS